MTTYVMRVSQLRQAMVEYFDSNIDITPQNLNDWLNHTYGIQSYKPDSSSTYVEYGYTVTVSDERKFTWFLMRYPT